MNDIWEVTVRDYDYTGQRANVYLFAKNAGEAEKKALAIARKDKETWPRPYVNSVVFQFEINSLK